MPKPTLRADGRWTLSLPTTRGTCRRYVYGRSPDECLRKYRNALDDGKPRVRPGSLSEFYLLEFGPYLAGRGLSPDTINRYDLSWRVSIGPRIGHLLWGELTTADVREAILAKGMASSAASAKNVLGQMARLAIALKLAPHEVQLMVQMVKVGTAARRERHDIALKAQLVLEAAEQLGHWTEGFVYLASTLGVRRSEAMGLKVSDIDLAAGTIRVGRQRNHTRGEYEQLKGRPEGKARLIGLPRTVLERILSYARPGAIYLVTEPDGTPPAPQHIARAMASVLKAAGVHVTPHDLRSAAISRLIDAGADDHAIMELVGHGCREMVAWYRDNRPERTRAALNKLAENE